MFVNRVKINLSTIDSGATATTINIPITLESQEIGQSEIIDKVFVDVEVEKAINPIYDYDKVRYLPIDSDNNPVKEIIYNLDFTGSTNYAAIGFENNDIKFLKNCFKESFLQLNFYDTDNPLNQRLISFITIFAKLNPNDLLPSENVQITTYGSVIGAAGQPKPASQIPLNFNVTNPLRNPTGFAEGFHLYDYRDELKIGESKYLYMRASFKNSKSGKSTNLMVKNTPQSVEVLVHELYTRYILSRTSNGYYYQLDTTYQGNTTPSINNVTYLSNKIIINLYQIQAI
jgi:hypothetical protein